MRRRERFEIELGGRKPRRSLRPLLYLLLAALALAALFYALPRLEWHAPEVRLDLAGEFVGAAPFTLEVRDRGRGLASLSVDLVAGGKERRLVAERYDAGVSEKKIALALAGGKEATPEGPALLRVVARDRSYWNFLRGNQTSLEKKIHVDFTPPRIELIADDRYVNFGGAGMIIYRVTPDTRLSGVRVGGYFFPGYGGQLEDPALVVALFAHPYDLPQSERAFIEASDAAGNRARVPLTYELKPVRYRRTSIRVEEAFIRTKVLPLLGAAAGQGKSPAEIFVLVNRDLRRKNEESIRQICARSAPKKLWSGPFHQLANSKVEANFADARTYFYNGQEIDRAYHLGYDLAVTRNSPVEAAQDGVVIFTGDLGIYGNSVIVDHGLGLFTLYSHLSAVEVSKGAAVKKTQPLGKTGETGLAVGDHLHYATLLHGVPVLPLEWWDGKWIRDNIEEPLREASRLARQNRN